MERKVFDRVRAQRWYLRFPRAAPVGIFLLVSAITALSVYAIEQVETQRAEAQDRQMAMGVVSAVERMASANVAYLKAGSALLSVRQDITHQNFREFAEQVDNDQSLRGGAGLGWARFVRAAEIPALERAMRASGDPAFTVRPKPMSDQALVITFVEQSGQHRAAGLGFDLLSDPVRGAAVKRALATGQPVATGSLALLSDPGGARSGFNMYAPVYDAISGRREPRGVISRGFNAQSFLAAAVTPEQMHDYGVALFDAEGADRTPMAAIGQQAPADRRILREVALADHRMMLEISPPPGSTLSSLSLLTLLFGMLVAALLLVVARLVTQQAAEDRAALAWFEEQASIRNSLTRELNHRVKNTLANVLSIVALTRRRTDNLDEFVGGLIGRIRALSATHDLLTQSEWGTTPIRAVVGAELAPYAQDADRAVEMRGPNVELAPNDALSLGLAIHELATNASKYGALSAPGGSVEVGWDMITDKLARIEWIERGGPLVTGRLRSGFGTELIEKIVAHELKNPVDLRFDPEGVRCTLIVPVRTPALFQLRGRGED